MRRLRKKVLGTKTPHYKNQLLREFVLRGRAERCKTSWVAPISCACKKLVWNPCCGRSKVIVWDGDQCPSKALAHRRIERWFRTVISYSAHKSNGFRPVGWLWKLNSSFPQQFARSCTEWWNASPLNKPSWYSYWLSCMWGWCIATNAANSIQQKGTDEG